MSNPRLATLLIHHHIPFILNFIWNTFSLHFFFSLIDYMLKTMNSFHKYVTCIVYNLWVNLVSVGEIPSSKDNNHLLLYESIVCLTFSRRFKSPRNSLKFIWFIRFTLWISPLKIWVCQRVKCIINCNDGAKMKK